MEFLPLNKFEKEKKVIELHTKEGKTLKEIATEVHMSFRDISKIIKAYDKKIRLQQTKREQENNQSSKIKKPSISGQAYKLFLDGKNPVQVAIDLQLDFEKVRKYWTEFLRMKNMKKLYNIYIDNEYHLDYLFKIYYFLLRNQIDFKNIENVLRIAYDITKLYQTHSNLKAEINRLEGEKMSLLYYSPSSSYYSLQPLPLKKPYYNYYSY